MIIIQNRFFKIFYLATILGILVFGLWPIGYNIPNSIKIIDNGAGVYFDGSKGRLKLRTGGIIYTPERLTGLNVDYNENQEFTLELWIGLPLNGSNGSGWILTFCDERYMPNLLIGQRNLNLVIRSYISQSGRKTQYSEIVAEGFFKTKENILLTMTSKQHVLCLYKDALLIQQYRDSNLFLNKMLSHTAYLTIGNKPNPSDPWTGTILGLSVRKIAMPQDEVIKSHKIWTTSKYSEENELRDNLVLKYNFNKMSSDKIVDLSGHENNLIIPKYYNIKKGPLNTESYRKIDRRDLIINIIGFIPLGFLLSLRMFSYKFSSIIISISFVVIFCFLLSFLIEFIQGYLPTRSSSYLDLICNTIGAIIGVILAGLYFKIAQPKTE